jgi:uncharacterized membrane protein YtjA (UPF0391 family)
MIKWAIIFFVLALVAGALGFGELAGAFIWLAQLLFWLFVIVAGIFLALALFAYKKVT